MNLIKSEISLGISFNAVDCLSYEPYENPKNIQTQKTTAYSTDSIIHQPSFFTQIWNDKTFSYVLWFSFNYSEQKHLNILFNNIQTKKTWINLINFV